MAGNPDFGDFSLSEEHQALRDAVRDLVVDKVAPRAAEVDETGEFPWDVYEALKDARFHAIHIPEEYGGEGGDALAACLVIEEVARGCASSSLIPAVNKLGTMPLIVGGDETLLKTYLPKVASGEAMFSYALSEREAGSDAASMKTRAVAGDGGWVLNGQKSWITNAGVSSYYTVMAVSDPAAGSRGISAFVVDAATPGLEVSDRIPVMAPHPLGTLRFSGCRIPADALLGAPGEGFKIAMRNLDIFRTSVAAAALGFARRALDEALGRATRRRMLGQMLADFQLTQAALADMATGIDAAALLTYRAAWVRDRLGERGTREVAMAKMVATETAQQVIDKAVQLFGGLGVKSGMAVELLYREIRPLRIYEGATEVQKLIIGRELLRQFEPPTANG